MTPTADELEISEEILDELSSAFKKIFDLAYAKTGKVNRTAVLLTDFIMGGIIDDFLFNYRKLVLAEWLDEEENVLEDGTVLGSEHKEEN